jgi:hypothetical protein
MDLYWKNEIQLWTILGKKLFLSSESINSTRNRNGFDYTTVYSIHNAIIFLKIKSLIGHLQLVSQPWQCVSDVVGELLVQNSLQVRSSHPVAHVAVRWVTASENN